MKRRFKKAVAVKSVTVLLLLSFCFTGLSQNKKDAFAAIDPEPFANSAHHWYDIFDKANVINPKPAQPR